MDAELQGLVIMNAGKVSQVNGAGFTLIELLVVIAIASVLLGILIPCFQRARTQVKGVVCRSNLKQWGTTLALYTDVSQGRFPVGSSNAAVFLLHGAYHGQDDSNRRSMGQTPCRSPDTRSITICPMADRVNRDIARARFVFDHEIGPFRWPTTEVLVGRPSEPWEVVRPEPPFLSSYGFNRWLLTTNPGLAGGSLRPQHYMDVLSFKGKPGIPVLLDCMTPGAEPREDMRPPVSELRTAVSVNGIDNFCLDRHQESINGLFLDGSVRRISLKQLWTLKWHRYYNTAGPWTKAGGVKPEDWPKWMHRFQDY